MKLSHFIFILGIFVFLLGCKAKMDVEMEKSNPLEGTTWEKVSGEYILGNNKLIKSVKSKYYRAMAIYGKTHCTYVMQDTSRKESNFSAGTYTIKGDSITSTIEMVPYYGDIGKELSFKFYIEGDKMVVMGSDMRLQGYDWKTYHEEWKKID